MLRQPAIVMPEAKCNSIANCRRVARKSLAIAGHNNENVEASSPPPKRDNEKTWKCLAFPGRSSTNEDNRG